MLIKIYPVLEEVAEGLPAAERLPSQRQDKLAGLTERSSQHTRPSLWQALIPKPLNCLVIQTLQMPENNATERLPPDKTSSPA